MKVNKPVPYQCAFLLAIYLFVFYLLLNPNKILAISLLVFIAIIVATHFLQLRRRVDIVIEFFKSNMKKTSFGSSLYAKIRGKYASDNWFEQKLYSIVEFINTFYYFKKTTILVNHKKQLLFYLIPKNGSTTISKLFLEEEGIKNKNLDISHQLCSITLTENEAQHSTYNSYTRFIVFRDPIQRIESCYKSKIKQPKSQNVLGISSKMSPNQFITFCEEELKKETYKQNEHIRMQKDFIQKQIDLIIPLENLTDFLKEKGFKKHGIIENKSKEANALFTKKQIHALKKIYEKDYEFFKLNKKKVYQKKG